MKILFEKTINADGMVTSKIKFLKIGHNPRKLGHRTAGPYKVLQTHVNGTLTIELKPGISERINIRRVIPYKK